MGVSEISFSHKYLLIRNISGKVKIMCSSPLKHDDDLRTLMTLGP